MYVVTKDEALITQDIGPRLSRLWYRWLKAARQGKVWQQKMELGMLDCPATLHQQIQRMVEGGPKAEIDRGDGTRAVPLNDAAFEAMLTLIPASLKATICATQRAMSEAEGYRKLAWTAIEKAWLPHELWHIGVREHLEGGKEVLALVRLLSSQEQEKPKAVDDFLGELFGEQGK